MLGQCLAGLLQVADPRNIGIHVGLLLLAVDLHLRHQQQDAVRVVLKLADLVASDVGALPLQFVQVPLALGGDLVHLQRVVVLRQFRVDDFAAQLVLLLGDTAGGLLAAVVGVHVDAALRRLRVLQLLLGFRRRLAVLVVAVERFKHLLLVEFAQVAVHRAIAVAGRTGGADASVHIPELGIRVPVDDAPLRMGAGGYSQSGDEQEGDKSAGGRVQCQRFHEGVL